MNRKKLGSGMLALALVGLIGVGGSLAWFTDTDSKQNSFTLNHVEIGVTEDKWSGPKEDYVPGTPCDKNPKVTCQIHQVIEVLKGFANEETLYKSSNFLQLMDTKK